MLAYAAHQRSRRQLSPTTLTMIIGVHAVALTLVAAAKMDIPIVPTVIKTRIYDVKDPPPQPPPPPPAEIKPRQQVQTPPENHIQTVKPIVNELPDPGPVVLAGSSSVTEVPDIGKAIVEPLRPVVLDPPKPATIRIAARAMTPTDLLRPPYPESKRRSEEEAVLRLRLSIDERGRVTDVAPVGAADPAFLAAAKAHLIRFWRYKPAMEDGRAVNSSMVITLRFELED